MSRWAVVLAVLAVATAGCTGATAPSATPTPAQTAARRAQAARPKPHVHRVRHAPPAKRHHSRPTPGVRRWGVPAAAMPRPGLTPGAAMTTDRSEVCVPGYSSRVRNVPSSESDAVYARYRVAHVPYAHEVDHLVSLEIGGSNAITNLWPEPYAGRWGARTKDALENRLHELVCSGAIGLRFAQRIEARNWVAAYKRYVGPTPPAPHRQPASPARNTAVAPPSGSGCEPGYSPCLPRVADLDCADIPAADRPVRVTGSDPYGLDANGDGYGCTS